MSVEELFNLEPDERDDLFCEKEDWTSEEIDKIILSKLEIYWLLLGMYLERIVHL